MKLKKEGFGTITLFIFIGGIVIALLTVVYFISKLYGSFDKATMNKEYIELETNLEIAAKRYINKMDIDVIGEYKIQYKTLKDLEYITNLKDKNNKECDGYVIIQKINNIDYYKGYIKCNNYETKGY